MLQIQEEVTRNRTMKCVTIRILSIVSIFHIITHLPTVESFSVMISRIIHHDRNVLCSPNLRYHISHPLYQQNYSYSSIMDGQGSNETDIEDTVLTTNQFNTTSTTSNESSTNMDTDDSDTNSNAINTDDNLFHKRNNKWIVFIDDEESIRLAVGDFLFNAGYTVTACADAQALLEILTQQQPQITQPSSGNSNSNNNNDLNFKNQRQQNSLRQLPNLIISDVRMPGQGMNGLQLLSVLKNPPPRTRNSPTPSSSNDYKKYQISKMMDEHRYRWKRIPFIILSARSLTQDRIEAYRLGADAFLSKPFHPEELLSIVDNLIKRQEEQSSYTSKGQLLSLKMDMMDVKEMLSLQNRNGPKYLSSSSLSSSSNNINSISNGLEIEVKLTPAETEVLEYVSQGYTNGEIAKLRGNLSAVGISRIVSRLYSKSNTKTRTELVRWGIDKGFITMT